MAQTNHARIMRLSFVVGIAGLCAACNSVGLGSLDPANLISSGSGTSTSAPNTGAVAMADTGEIDCPQIEVQDGTAFVRVGGQTNDTIRYQFDIANTARECHVQGGQFSVKIGVAGHLLIGPAGNPGAYSTQLRIVVRRDLDQKPVFSQAYKIAADTAGGSQAPFQFVSDPIMLPFTHQQEDQDFTFLVGFDNAHPAAAAPKSHRKKHPN
jgi:hypothetical protein